MIKGKFGRIWSERLKVSQCFVEVPGMRMALRVSGELSSGTRRVTASKTRLFLGSQPLKLYLIGTYHHRNRHNAATIKVVSSSKKHKWMVLAEVVDSRVQ